jgi:hypothetical protein
MAEGLGLQKSPSGAWYNIYRDQLTASESRVAELTRQVESLKEQLQGATANVRPSQKQETKDV